MKQIKNKTITDLRDMRSKKSIIQTQAVWSATKGKISPKRAKNMLRILSQMRKGLK